jgi:hypothetical protein
MIWYIACMLLLSFSASPCVDLSSWLSPSFVSRSRLVSALAACSSDTGTMRPICACRSSLLACSNLICFCASARDRSRWAIWVKAASTLVRIILISACDDDLLCAAQTLVFALRSCSCSWSFAASDLALYSSDRATMPCRSQE